MKIDTGMIYVISYNLDLILHIKPPKTDNSALSVWHVAKNLMNVRAQNIMSNLPLFQRRLLQYGSNPDSHLHEQSICPNYLCRLLLEEQVLSPPTNS
jgi:hypothetical protein